MFNYMKIRNKIIPEINSRSMTDNAFSENKKGINISTYLTLTSVFDIPYCGSAVFPNRPLHHFELPVFGTVSNACSLGKLFVGIFGLKRPMIKELCDPNIVFAGKIIAETPPAVKHCC